MGMFDSVYARCPRCSAEVEFQSKAGACTLQSYRPDEVPAEIANDLIGHAETCKCGLVMELTPHYAEKHVPMAILIK